MKTNSLRKAFLAALFLCMCFPLYSATITSAGSGNWSSTSTWVGGVVPMEGDNVVIASGHNVTLTAAVDITTGNLTVTGTIALAGFNLKAGSLSGAGNIGSASGTPLLTVGSNGSNTTYSGIFSGTGAQLTKEGTGTLTLSGANTYTGTTTINAGTLRLSANERISNSSALVIASGATFDMNGRTETVASIAGGGTVTSTTTGTITLSSGGNNSSTTFSGVIQNGSATSIALTKTGTGTLTLSGANTYTGTTTISGGGVLSIGDGGTSGSIAGNITNNASLIVNRSDDLTYSGVISGTGTLTKQGAGILTLTGANTYTGATTISTGTISIGSGGTIGSIASTSIVNNAALIFNRSNDITYTGVISSTGTLTKQGAGTLFLTGTNTYTGTTTISAGTLSIGNGGFTGTIAGTNIDNNAALVFNSQNSQTCSGIIFGTGTLTKLATGTLILSGNNTYSGSTTISGGTISINADNRLGAAPSVATPGHLVFNGGGLNATSNFTLNANRGITLNAGGGFFTGFTMTFQGIIAGSGRLNISGTLTLSGTSANTYTGGTTVTSGTLNISGDNKLGAVPGSATPGNITLNGGMLSATTNFTLNTNRSISLGTFAGNTISTGGTLAYGGIISGSGTLIKAGAGTLTLSGANTYTGATTVSGGILVGNNANAFRFSSSVTVNANCTLRSDVALTLPPITLSGTGATAGKMNCNGFNSNCGQLRLNATWQTAAGSWGRSTSGATNQNDTYFSGATGVLNVSGPMIIEVVTTAPNQTVTLPLSGTVNVVVNWGDATTNTYTTDADVNKVFAAAGTYTITISGILTQFGNGDNPDGPGAYANPERITKVISWGGTGLQSLFAAFRGCTNLVQVPSDFPPNVTNVGWMFKNSNFNQPIGTWNMSNVRRMGHMFENNTAFNQDIGAWDVSNVTDMRFMFLGATAFNNGGSPSIGNWNTASLNRPRGMFLGCTAFDQNLGNWNTNLFNDARDMFAGAQLSFCNYDATLIGWANRTPGVINSNAFNGGNSRYTSASLAARAILSGGGNNWVITDGGLIDPSLWVLTSAAGTDNQLVDVNTPITNITYNFGGNERAVFMGLPPGVTGTVSGSGDSRTVTISGTPTEEGIYNYSVGFCNELTGTIETLRILPIELLSFTAAISKEDEIKVSWSTAQEKNNAFFTLEKSLDGSSWSAIGIIPGAGDSDIVLFYDFLDESPVYGRQFYRLTQTDFDGKSETFKTIGITLKSKNEQINYKIYPNPSTGLVKILSQNDNMEDAEITVLDYQGHIVRNEKGITGRLVELDLSALPKGLYLVHIKNNHYLETKKVALQ